MIDTNKIVFRLKLIDIPHGPHRTNVAIVSIGTV